VAKQVPESLASRGLARATNNLPVGASVSIPARHFVMCFRTELERMGFPPKRRRPEEGVSK
jgi:hypothetical protein